MPPRDIRVALHHDKRCLHLSHHFEVLLELLGRFVLRKKVEALFDLLLHLCDCSRHAQLAGSAKGSQVGDEECVDDVVDEQLEQARGQARLIVSHVVGHGLYDLIDGLVDVPGGREQGADGGLDVVEDGVDKDLDAALGDIEVAIHGVVEFV